jgi:DsbC/DsbD-like thiol-disulfide interchange protein
MTRFLAVLIALTPIAASAAGPEPLPLGLQSARLLPGWTAEDGSRIAALELVLEPGWKTYWRSPGDSGLPPSFAWEGSRNLGEVTFHWPAPEAIQSGGVAELGYHDRLVLPFTALPARPGQPIALSMQADLGLCENICVPAHLDLTAPGAAASPDARILDALAAAPEPLADQPACRIEEIADGLRVTVALPKPAELAALEVTSRDDLWISVAQITGAEASAELVGPEAAPFPLDPGHLRLTAIGASGAVETTGCRL